MRILRGLSPIIARGPFGLTLGVFIGEPAGVLSIGGDIYIRRLIPA